MEILKPVAVLAGWTMIMWIWMYATRLPAMTAAKLNPDDLAKNPTNSLDDYLPAQIQWKAHNYNHLHEAPTVFYAVALALALIGQGDGLNATLGWAYVALRVAHSLVQATVNKVLLRFSLFALSSLCLMALVLHLLIALFH
ncbi:hypothetical protein C0V78_04525 [Novosphingobium sp. TH158]|nr:hypothetical protein C0V78_04525 [Novosphingobium sp. TH158]